MVFCEHGNDLLVSVTGKEFLKQLNEYQLLKNCVPWSLLHVFISCTDDCEFKI